MMNRLLNLKAVYSAPNEQGAAAPSEAAPATEPTTPTTILTDKAATTRDTAHQEYVADPAKSEQENALAKAEHDKAQTDKKPSDDVAPEDGKYTLTMPEGVELDAQLLDAISPKFKELGLTNKQAQSLADSFIAHQQETMKARVEEWSNTVSSWAENAKKDPEIGGSKWDETARLAGGVVSRFGTPELAAYLDETGAGNHPEMIRLMAKIGSVISEDRPASGGTAAKPAQDQPENILFPTSKK